MSLNVKLCIFFVFVRFDTFLRDPPGYRLFGANQFPITWRSTGNKVADIKFRGVAIAEIQSYIVK